MATTPKGVNKDMRAASLQISTVFPWQSWFDTTLLQKAIAVQPSGTQIVLPQKESQYGGHSLILHKSSQVPVAVTAKGDDGSSPTVYVLAPGQSVSPLGSVPFRSFTWGLPFGWLGGGMATLLIGQQIHEPSFAVESPEIPFHRARFAIQQPASLLTAGYNNSPLNWPIWFPWVQTTNSSSIGQPGAPIVAPYPTRIVMTLRPPAANQVPGNVGLATAANMIAIIQGADDFNMDAGGVAGNIDLYGAAGTNEGGYPIFDTFTWPAWTNVGTSGNLAVQNPELTVNPASGAQALLRLGCSGVPGTATAVGVTFVDVSGGNLAGYFVDVVRYGVL